MYYRGMRDGLYPDQNKEDEVRGILSADDLLEWFLSAKGRSSKSFTVFYRKTVIEAIKETIEKEERDKK